MLELILFSVVSGLFVKGWLGKLVVFPIGIALYTTLRFFFSPKARQIRENRKLEGRGAGMIEYLLIFGFRLVICVAVSGAVGFAVSCFKR